MSARKPISDFHTGKEGLSISQCNGAVQKYPCQRKLLLITKLLSEAGF